MKTIKIGSFEAKTHFSALLRGVLEGKHFEILRHGKPVAQLTGIRSADNYLLGRKSLEYFRDLRRGTSVTLRDIGNWIDEGRR